MSQPWSTRDELERIRNVSDTLCTGHAGLRDRFVQRALVLDLCILGLSSWLVALTFIEPRINVRLTPFGLDSQIWVGVLSVGTFFLTLVQFKTDWKGRADAHKRTFDIYAEVKREAGYLLAAGDIEETACRRLLARYDMASAAGVAIPESEFLRQKRRHKIKVALSKHLDGHPSASLLLTRIRFCNSRQLSPGSLMVTPDLEGALRVFAAAATYMANSGRDPEVQWQRQVALEGFSETDLLRECAWVILCSGFRERIVRRVFDYVSLCFCDWESASAILDADPICRTAAISAIPSFFRGAKMQLEVDASLRRLSHDES